MQDKRYPQPVYPAANGQSQYQRQNPPQQSYDANYGHQQSRQYVQPNQYAGQQSYDGSIPISSSQFTQYTPNTSSAVYNDPYQHQDYQAQAIQSHYSQNTQMNTGSMTQSSQNYHANPTQTSHRSVKLNQSQVQQSFGQDYFNEFQNSATGQLGMQLGTQAFNSAQEKISSNVSRYFDIAQWRYYFDVSNSYVLNKIKLLLFPFIHKTWTRTVKNEGDLTAYAAPRADLNSPDLYIPVMSFVSYIIIVGFRSGLSGGTAFSPDILGLTASSAFFVILIEVLLVKAGFYFLNVSTDIGLLDLISYTGYKFIP